MSIDPNCHVPIYEQIIDHIRTSIAAGVFRAGESVPSTRALALELLVNPNTVQRAYQELERQGLICTQRGKGAFVARGGVACAVAGSERAVQSRFEQGIRVGQAARLPAGQIRSIFTESLHTIGRRTGDDDTSNSIEDGS